MADVIYIIYFLEKIDNDFRRSHLPLLYVMRPTEQQLCLQWLGGFTNKKKKRQGAKFTGLLADDSTIVFSPTIV